MKSIILIAVVMGAGTAQAYQIEHLEPAFWWAGMKEPKLQLMVHAKDIQQAKVQLNYPGVKLTGLQKVKNPNYLFVDLELSPDVKPGSFELVLSLGCRGECHTQVGVHRPQRPRYVLHRHQVHLRRRRP